jgi:hypothetical protein
VETDTPGNEVDEATLRQRSSRRKYNASPKGREARRRYAATEGGREAQKRAKARWNRDNADIVAVASRARKRAQLERIAAIKVAAGCADCGYAEHFAALEFDHVEGGKVANVSALVGKRWDVIEAEIAKCEVVCANCHRIRTVERLR